MRLGSALFHFWEMREHFAEGRALLEKLLKLPATAQPKMRARLLFYAAIFAIALGDFGSAQKLQEESLKVCRNLDDRGELPWLSMHWGSRPAIVEISIPHARFSSSASRLGEAWVQLGDGWGIASTVCDLARLSAADGQHQHAAQLYGESIKIFQDLGHKRGIARVLECLAVSAAAQSRPQHVLHLAGAAAALRQRIGAPLIPAEQSRLEKKLEPAQHAHERRRLGSMVVRLGVSRGSGPRSAPRTLPSPDQESARVNPRCRGQSFGVPLPPDSPGTRHVAHAREWFPRPVPGTRNRLYRQSHSCAAIRSSDPCP
jgi:tetratricopeptide (TPR) repeat protein